MALPTAQSIILFTEDYLIGASYDKCLQVFGEITRCPALVAESKEVFLKACPGDL